MASKRSSWTEINRLAVLAGYEPFEVDGEFRIAQMGRKTDKPMSRITVNWELPDKWIDMGKNGIWQAWRQASPEGHGGLYGSGKGLGSLATFLEGAAGRTERRNMAGVFGRTKAQKFSVESVEPGRAPGDFVVEVRLESGGFATVRTAPCRVSTTGQRITSSTSPLSAKQELAIEKAVAKQSKNRSVGNKPRSHGFVVVNTKTGEVLSQLFARRDPARKEAADLYMKGVPTGVHQVMLYPGETFDPSRRL